MAAKKTTTKGSGWGGWKPAATKAKVPTTRAAPKPKANGKVRGGNAHERDLAWHASAKAKKTKAKAEPKSPPPLEPGQVWCAACEWVGKRAECGKPGARPHCPECGKGEQFLEINPEPEKPSGVLLSKATDFEVDEPMDETELRVAKGNAIEAKGALVCAEHAVKVAKEELKAAKAHEESCRAAWDELAMRLAKGAKKVKVSCRVLLEHDDKVRAYNAETGELVDERDPTRDELKKARQPDLPGLDDEPEPTPPEDAPGGDIVDPDATPKPERVVVLDDPPQPTRDGAVGWMPDDDGPDAFDGQLLEGEYIPPTRALPARSSDLADGPEAA
jgi:hypothetical protein